MSTYQHFFSTTHTLHGIVFLATENRPRHTGSVFTTLLTRPGQFGLLGQLHPALGSGLTYCPGPWRLWQLLVGAAPHLPCPSPPTPDHYTHCPRQIGYFPKGTAPARGREQAICMLFFIPLLTPESRRGAQSQVYVSVIPGHGMVARTMQ